METIVTAFDRPYSRDKQVEGIAILWAVVNGACDGCKHLSRCERDKTFVFPANAECMKKKAELLSADQA